MQAEEDGIAAVEHIAGRGGHVNYDAVPSIVYTHPEVASVGKTEEQCKAEGVQYRVSGVQGRACAFGASPLLVGGMGSNVRQRASCRQ